MNRLTSLSLLLVCLGLVGCQPYWYPEPEFGTTVNQAVSAQLQNPNAPKGTPKSVVGIDGEAAKLSVDSYYKTFERKQAPISSGSGSMTGGSSGLTIQ